jgi:folate-binding Fe-S cluster repair protein YgfZ
MVVMPENGARLFYGDKEVGFIGTVARHYELGPIALAVIKRNTPADCVLIADGVSANWAELSLKTS